MLNKELCLGSGTSTETFLEFVMDETETIVKAILTLDSTRYDLGNLMYLNGGNAYKVWGSSYVDEHYDYFFRTRIGFQKNEYVFENPKFPGDPWRHIGLRETRIGIDGLMESVIEVDVSHYEGRARWYTLCVGKFPLISSI